jgi:hypothetical protein
LRKLDGGVDTTLAETYKTFGIAVPMEVAEVAAMHCCVEEEREVVDKPLNVIFE